MAIRIQDLYTFHVVARAGTMQDAARELGVTPGAISQRIRGVEERHGVRLFTRGKNGIALTAAGLELYSDVGSAFDRIEAVQARYFSKRQTTLRLSAAPTFAYSMLVTSLGKFADRHPAIKVTVETGDRLVDLRNEPVDIALRHGLGDYPGVMSEWLCSPELVLVASPALLSRHGPLNTATDCLRYKLLPDATGKDWPLWFEAQGVDAQNARYGTRYNDDFMTVKAASEGQGLALLNDVYVAQSLASGQLVKALDIHWPTAFAYYAVALEETFERPAVITLVEWLKNDLR